MYKIGTVIRKVKNLLGFGAPKAAGKSTFVLTAPQPIILLNYDTGDPGLPPGVGPDVWVQNYPTPDANVPTTDSTWARSKNIGAAMIEDILTIRKAVLEGKPVLLKDHVTGEITETPPLIGPDFAGTLILDGIVALNSAIIDWLLACEGRKEVDSDKDAIKLWGRRLDRMNNLFRFVLPLPINVCLITWETDETYKKAGEPMPVPTGAKIPDIGGKLDTWGAGKVDASLYFYNNGAGKFLVQTKPNSVVKCVGIRGRYELPDVIDVTIHKADVIKPGYVQPWNRVWSAAVSTEKKL